MEQSNPVLVVGSRSNLAETRFRGSVSIVGKGAQECFSLGNTGAYVYPRSTLKYFQVLPLLLSGAVDTYGFSDTEIAVMCASHNGEAEHLAQVAAIFKKAGLDLGNLRCGTHRPLGEAASDSLIRNGQSPENIHNNCSGKHAGFLSLAKFLGADLHTYLHPDHPVQQQIRTVVAEMCNWPEEKLHVGIDGCAAPNYAMPLRNLAIGVYRFATGENLSPQYAEACQKASKAITQNPFYIAGTNRYCTDLMNASEGKVIAKLGADGVYVLGLPDLALGIAIKMDDGATGPQYAVAQQLLEHLGVLSADAIEVLRPYKETITRNCNGADVGVRKAVEGNFAGLTI